MFGGDDARLFNKRNTRPFGAGEGVGGAEFPLIPLVQFEPFVAEEGRRVESAPFRIEVIGDIPVDLNERLMNSHRRTVRFQNGVIL